MPSESFIYANRPEGPLQLHVFRPMGDVNRATAVLHLHGGGWRGGSPALLNLRSASLAAHGYTVIQVQYRLLSDTVRWPAPVTDLRSAIRWVSTHVEELGVRRDAITLWGHSAGAHICLMTAGTVKNADFDDPQDDLTAPLSIAAVIDCYGPVNFSSGDTPLFVVGPTGPDFATIAANQRSDGALPGIDLLGESCSEQQARCISPVEQIDTSFPPTMVVHGTDDTLITVANSIVLRSVLGDLGVMSELVTFAGCNHEFDAAPSYAAALAGHIDVFLRRVLADPELRAEIDEHSMFRTAVHT